MLNIAPTSINTTTKETTSFPLEQGWIEALQAQLNLSQISLENLMLKIVTTSMNTATTATMTEGTILFPLERGRIEALSLSLSLFKLILILFNSLKKNCYYNFNQ
jgi:hypothetical protein